MCISSVGLREKAKRGKEKEFRDDYRTKQRKKKNRKGGKEFQHAMSVVNIITQKPIYFLGTYVRGSEWVGKNECTKLPYLLYLFLLCLGLPRWKCALCAIGSSPPGDQIKPICIRHAARTLQHWPVNGSGRSLRALAVTRLLGVWSSLAMGWSLRILPAQNLWSQGRRCAYFLRPV